MAITNDPSQLEIAAGCDMLDMNVMEMQRLSILHHVYAKIIDFSLGIFSTSLPHDILQGCAFLLNSIHPSNIPDGISMVRLLTICSDVARSLGGFLSARAAYHWIATDCSIPIHQREKLTVDMMTIEVSLMGGTETEMLRARVPLFFLISNSYDRPHLWKMIKIY